jgi:hypothetical protein
MKIVIFIIVILKSGILPLIILMSVIFLLVAILSDLANCNKVKRHIANWHYAVIFLTVTVLSVVAPNIVLSKKIFSQ